MPARSASPSFRPGAPRHEQLSDWLRERIRAGEMAAHDQLPSEAELGELSGVSRITVRRALGTLENEGRIYRRQGLGSFVAPPPLPQGLVRLTDFAQDMERAGLKASSRVLHQAPEPAPHYVAEALGVDADAPTVRLDRLRLGDGKPVALDRTWLPPFYAQFLEGHDLTTETIYRVLERDYEIPVLRGQYRIEAAVARADEAGPLGVPEGAPVLLVERTSYTAGERAVYYQRRYYRADRVAFDLELARPDATAGGDGELGMPLREFEPVFKGA
ncbi:GntR family transcriptional regulator [Rubricoccus marinus]|uniref:GntR family transcriptional regulator n=1 Tax=Rubricoccus marinus TaxID=716817 RepID=A0A259TUI3_9BACT|nr:GntR family transcriptional regulator [Rubricoccus marinus]OZC01432.1 GntR family transcriptional regulator [Rubricoccus marinus]